LYPIPLNPWLPPGQVLVTAAVLLIITGVAAANVVWRPWLAAGWAWFLLITFPMSGIVAIGEHSHADRYTYLPHPQCAALADARRVLRHDRRTGRRPQMFRTGGRL
jgi:hypothetical protein